MASPPPLHRHHRHGELSLYPPLIPEIHVHQKESNLSLYPPLFSAIPFGPCCCFCVRRIFLHHHHHALHSQPSPPFMPPAPSSVLPHAGVSYPGEQSAVPAVDGGEFVKSTLIYQDPLSKSGPSCAPVDSEQAWAEQLGGELGGQEDEEEEEEEEGEDVYVLTDEWAEFFAKSEAKRQLERRQRKKQNKGST